MTRLHLEIVYTLQLTGHRIIYKRRYQVIARRGAVAAWMHVFLC